MEKSHMKKTKMRDGETIGNKALGKNRQGEKRDGKKKYLAPKCCLRIPTQQQGTNTIGDRVYHPTKTSLPGDLPDGDEDDPTARPNTERNSDKGTKKQI